MNNLIRAALEESAAAVTRLSHDEATLATIEQAARALIHSFQQGGRVFSCGNGGSLCDAMHFAEELSGRFRHNRRGLPATAISDASHLSCVANDFGYEQVFSRYIESHGRAGDVLLAISTSGSSKNVVAAAETARELKLVTISLTGKTDSILGDLADHDICTPAGTYSDRVQELHIKVIHILVEMTERALFPENYSDSSGV
ncbi:MAG: SIS domain-containing protein [Cytophagales bacterium]|nr:SIS domain-containing protein [Armatimonadota bacterium]